MFFNVFKVQKRKKKPIFSFFYYIKSFNIKINYFNGRNYFQREPSLYWNSAIHSLSTTKKKLKKIT
jgi:hypothetical protein